jgi:hypothetical protein
MMRRKASRQISASQAILALSYPIGQARLTQSRPSEGHNAERNRTTELFEILRTTQSMRRLKPDAVPNELIRKILEAGVCAPSGGNMQRWRFLVIRDPKVKERVGALLCPAPDRLPDGTVWSSPPCPTRRCRLCRPMGAALQRSVATQGPYHGLRRVRNDLKLALSGRWPHEVSVVRFFETTGWVN